MLLLYVEATTDALPIEQTLQGDESMKSTTVTIEKMDLLFLKWHSHINASGLYREAIRDVMEQHDVEPHELRDLVERAAERGHDLDDLVERTDRFEDLEALIEEEREITR